MYPVPISDHAVIRYMERVYGIDTDKVRSEILSEEDYETYKHLKDFKIKRENCILVLQEGCVVTVLSKEMEGVNTTKREYEKIVAKRKKRSGKE